MLVYQYLRLPLPSRNTVFSVVRELDLRIPLDTTRYVVIRGRFVAITFNKDDTQVNGVLVIVLIERMPNNYLLRIFILPHLGHFIAPSTLIKSPSL